MRRAKLCPAKGLTESLDVADILTSRWAVFGKLVIEHRMPRQLIAGAFEIARMFAGLVGS
jgi:hypothetical protein